MCKVMGIVNVTPDSFSDGGKFNTPEEAIRRADKERADDEKTLARVREVAEKAESLRQEYRRDLTLEELLDETGWDRAQVEQILRITSGGIEGLTDTPVV